MPREGRNRQRQDGASHYCPYGSVQELDCHEKAIGMKNPSMRQGRHGVAGERTGCALPRHICEHAGGSASGLQPQRPRSELDQRQHRAARGGEIPHEAGEMGPGKRVSSRMASRLMLAAAPLPTNAIAIRQASAVKPNNAFYCSWLSPARQRAQSGGPGTAMYSGRNLRRTPWCCLSAPLVSSTLIA